MRFENCSGILKIIGIATATAIEFCLAGAAFRLFIHVGFGKKLLFFLIQ